MATDSLFRTSEKCSTHLLAWVSSVVRGFPYLSLTMITLVLVCLQSCLVSLETALISHLSATVFTFIAAILST